MNDIKEKIVSLCLYIEVRNTDASGYFIRPAKTIDVGKRCNFCLSRVRRVFRGALR